VTALDAYALVAFFANEPARPDVEAILRGQCVMSCVNFAESLDVLERAYGVEEDQLRARLDPLLSGVIDIDEPSATDAWAAARLRSQHYARSTRALSMADCFLLAMGARLSVAVATADPAVAETAREESIELVPLPDRSGTRPAG
jgi:PIN domain nuclease of toxin-antitoxin system